jgi:hypothetical protein
MYSGVEWTSVTEVDGELAMTLYPTTTPTRSKPRFSRSRKSGDAFRFVG